jgi:hypothetical protein
LIIFNYALLQVLEINFFRTVLTPWYAAAFVLLWIGLLGLAYVFWADRREKHEDEIPMDKYVSWAAAFGVWLFC